MAVQHQQRSSSVTAGVADRAARAGLWLLPVHALLLAVSTLTHQPDPREDFAGYADYVTTDVFLVSHLVASILGAALGVLGLVAALWFLVAGPTARRAVWGAAAGIVGTVVTTSVLGPAAFAQPAIGRAYQDGLTGIEAVDEDVYGTPLFATAGVGLLGLVVGAILLGTAISRSRPDLRLAGIGYAVLLPVFAVIGIPFGPVQPVAALALTFVTVLIARRLPGR